MKNNFYNVSELISYQTKSLPGKVALVAKKASWLNFLFLSTSKTQTLTFSEIEQRINHYTHAFIESGLAPGDRILTFIKPSLDFPIIIFSLFRAGIIPVFIDPGMGVDALLTCIESSQAKALIGIPKIHHLRILKSNYFNKIEFFFVIGGRAINATSFDQILKKSSAQKPFLPKLGGTDTAAILYTSGGTGKPKGVVYTHEMFIQQALRLKQMFKLAHQDRDYPCFPLFGLFSLSLGLCVYMPEVDLMKPAQVNAKAICKSLIKYKITFATGSPALWKRVADYALSKKIKFPHLKTVATFGAPVSLDLHRDLGEILPHGEVYTPYGATECLPVSMFSSHEILGETKALTLMGEGTCVGYPAPSTVVAILDTQTNGITDNKEVIGEIIVSSSTMTPGYDGGVEQNEGIKYTAADGKTYHRMGDLGKIDVLGRLWFLGRKVHCIPQGSTWLCTEEIEPAVNNLPEVYRSALVKLNQKIVLVIERKDRMIDLPPQMKEKFFKKVYTVLEKLPKGHLVEDILLDSNFPVDARHNIKIDRLQIAKNLNQKGFNFL